MTWYAVPDDSTGGPAQWAVANRQWTTSRIYMDGVVANHMGRQIVARCVPTELEARRIAAGLNFIDSPYADSAERVAGRTRSLWEAEFVDRYSVPWPGEAS